nr:hypothetical protein [Thermoplasma sp. Kam2015]
MESVVAEIDSVAECAVIGVPDEIKGLVPVVFIMPKNNARIDGIEEEVARKIEEGIGRFARPSSIILVDEMPKTPSGKILRRFLREVYVHGDIVGDRTGLENPSSIEKLKSAILKKAS